MKSKKQYQDKFESKSKRNLKHQYKQLKSGESEFDVDSYEHVRWEDEYPLEEYMET